MCVARNCHTVTHKGRGFSNHAALFATRDADLSILELRACATTCASGCASNGFRKTNVPSHPKRENAVTHRPPRAGRVSPWSAHTARAGEHHLSKLARTSQDRRRPAVDAPQRWLPLAFDHVSTHQHRAHIARSEHRLVCDCHKSAALDARAKAAVACDVFSPACECPSRVSPHRPRSVAAACAQLASYCIAVGCADAGACTTHPCSLNKPASRAVK